MNGTTNYIQGIGPSKHEKQTLVHLIIKKQDQRFLCGWNYCSGTSNYREAVYWVCEILVCIMFLLSLWLSMGGYAQFCALIYFLKHILLLPDYIYLIMKREYLWLDLFTNILNIQFWVCSLCSCLGMPVLFHDG